MKELGEFKLGQQETSGAHQLKVFRLLVGNNCKDFMVPQPIGVFRSK